MLQISQDSKDILSKLFIDGDAKTLSTTLSQSLLNSIDRPDDLAAISLNAKYLMNSLMLAMVEMRDKGEILLTPKYILDNLTVERFIELSDRSDFSDETKLELKSFLRLHGYECYKLTTVAEQFGYTKSYWTEYLRQLSKEFLG